MLLLDVNGTRADSCMEYFGKHHIPVLCTLCSFKSKCMYVYGIIETMWNEAERAVRNINRLYKILKSQTQYNDITEIWHVDTVGSILALFISVGCPFVCANVCVYFSPAEKHFPSVSLVPPAIFQCVINNCVNGTNHMKQEINSIPAFMGIQSIDRIVKSNVLRVAKQFSVVSLFMTNFKGHSLWSRWLLLNSIEDIFDIFCHTAPVKDDEHLPWMIELIYKNVFEFLVKFCLTYVWSDVRKVSKRALLKYSP